MATKKVNIDIIAKDKSKAALNNVRGGLDRVKSSVFNLKNAFIGLGAGMAVRSLIKTGIEIENLQVRLKFLFGTAEEGAKAFDEMAKFASKVPFSLEEIQQGAGVLAIISKDAEELAKNMELTGNVAAVSGLDFKTASEQIQRALSSGIGAADLFREKGVTAMLGFKAGAKVTVEETAEAFERVFGASGQFAGSTTALAQTFSGTLSMIGDKFFNFKRTILEAGFFPELKKQFKDLDTFLQENSTGLDEFAKKIGKGLAIAVKNISEGFKVLKENADLVAGAFASIIAFKLAGVFITVTGALANLTIGMRAFNFATKQNIIFASVGVFAATFGLLIEKFREFKGELSDGTFGVDKSARSITNLQFEINRLTEAVEFRLNSGLKNMKTIMAGPEIPESGKSINMLNDEIKALVEELKFATSNQEKFGMVSTEAADNAKKLAIENSKAYADMKDSTGDALLDIQNANERAFKKTISQYKLFAFTMKQAKRNDEAQMLKETQVYYDKFTEAMSKRYRMEQKFIRQNKEEQDSQAEKYTAHMLKRGRINDEAMSKDKTLFGEFKNGFKESMQSGADAMTLFVDAGKQSFDALQKTLTDFVMTGKLNFEDFARTVTRLIVEALIGSAIQSAVKKSTELLKAETIRKALMYVYEGALKVFASIPFPFNIVAVGGAIASGMALVNQIKGFEKGGRPPVGQPSIVGEGGPELFVPDSSGTIVPNNKLGGKPVTVNFNINTVDARGFNELLVNSRGVIVNLINSAVNEKGRQAII